MQLAIRVLHLPLCNRQFVILNKLNLIQSQKFQSACVSGCFHGTTKMGKMIKERKVFNLKALMNTCAVNCRSPYYEI